MTILIQGNGLSVAGQSLDALRISSKSNQIAHHSGMALDPVIAGRGFHWQKSVTMTFPGDLKFVNHKGHLLVTNELPLEQYLMCVATSEMGAACPPALIAAQTIVARSFILANAEKKHSHLGFDFCNDDCCQRYHGTEGLSQQSVRGSENTRGLVPVFDGQVCDTRYSKSCGGMIESFQAVWGNNNPPYFKVKPDLPENSSGPDLTVESNFRDWVDNPPLAFCSPEYIPESELPEYLGGVDEEGHYYRWRIFYSQEEITRLIAQKAQRELRAIKALIPLERGSSGRIIKLEIQAIDDCGDETSIFLNSEYDIRYHLHDGFLYSSAFYVIPIENGDFPSEFFIHGGGWGHGAGLCQIGALGMSLADYDFPDIIKHYYPGITLKRLYT